MFFFASFAPLRETFLAPLNSSNKRKGKDCQIPQDMDGDGGHQVFFDLIGYGKEDASDHLCHRYRGEDWVC